MSGKAGHSSLIWSQWKTSKLKRKKKAPISTPKVPGHTSPASFSSLVT